MMKTLSQVRVIPNVEARVIAAASLLEYSLRERQQSTVERQTLSQLAKAERIFCERGIVVEVAAAIRTRNAIAHPVGQLTWDEKEHAARTLIQAIELLQADNPRANHYQPSTQTEDRTWRPRKERGGDMTADMLHSQAGIPENPYVSAKSPVTTAQMFARSSSTQDTRIVWCTETSCKPVPVDTPSVRSYQDTSFLYFYVTPKVIDLDLTRDAQVASLEGHPVSIRCSITASPKSDDASIRQLVLKWPTELNLISVECSKFAREHLAGKPSADLSTIGARLQSTLVAHLQRAAQDGRIRIETSSVLLISECTGVTQMQRRILEEEGTFNLEKVRLANSQAMQKEIHSHEVSMEDQFLVRQAKLDRMRLEQERELGILRGEMEKAKFAGEVERMKVLANLESENLARQIDILSKTAGLPVETLIMLAQDPGKRQALVDIMRSKNDRARGDELVSILEKLVDNLSKRYPGESGNSIQVNN